MAVKSKHQRLILILVALTALIGAAVIAGNALRDEVSYFYTPSTLTKSKNAADKAVRLGGMVQPGSIQRSTQGVGVRFIIQDKDQQINVFYKGITPDLFVEGSGVTADGKLGTDGTFYATGLLAKHDENYVPRELADMDQITADKTKDSIAK